MSVLVAFFHLLISEVRFYDPSLYSARKFGLSNGVHAVPFASCDTSPQGA